MRKNKIISLLLVVTLLFNTFVFLFSVWPMAQGTIVDIIPDEYKSYISELQSIHPNWKFEFLQTGINWSDIINKEDACSGGSAYNTVSGSYPLSYRSTSATSYNGSTDTYTVMDGSSWYQASGYLISYYMDPRNFLNEKSVFQFEKLGYDSSTQTLSGVEKMLSKTFMANTEISNGVDNITYAQAYIDAAQSSGVSPYHLVSKTIQEVGSSGSVSTSGANSSYPGIYNFYNIGATAGSNPAVNGLKWASQTSSNKLYMRPWNSQYKSIVGGASYIGNSYINKGQNTIYFEKFDVIGYYGYLHQYMSNVMGAYTEGVKVYNAYRNMDMLNNSFTFVIPVYNNMPSEKSALPLSTGSPACWLNTLSAAGCSITPTFYCDPMTNDYTIIAPSEINAITLQFSAFNGSAAISGLGGIQSGSSGLTTGHVTVSSKLNIRTGPGTTYSYLTYNGSKVQLLNNTAVSYIDTKIISGQTWFNISFSYGGTQLSGWACGINNGDSYLSWDAPRLTNSCIINLGDSPISSSLSVTYGTMTRTYNLIIYKEKASNYPIVFNTTYSINDNCISGIKESTTYDGFKNNLGLLTDISINYSKQQQYIGTGTLVTISSPTEQKYLTAIIYGDINGDGIIDAIDLMMVQKNILGLYNPGDYYAEAMDVNFDDVVDAIDLMMVQKNILNLYQINK